MSTILVLLGAILVVAAAVASLRLDKKRGKSSCGGNCGACGACRRCAEAQEKRAG